jgi:predicted metal-dependent hydrolase
MNRIINLDGRKVKYELERKKVKNINLRIRSNGSVYLSANNRISESIIEKFLQKKSDCILSALDKYAEITKYTDNKYNYVTGESFRYLGKELRLIVTNGKNGINSDGVYLTLSVININNMALKKKLISKWYDKQCKKISTEIVFEIFKVFKKYKIAMPKISLRNMTSRWGSCQPKKGIITLNKRLIEIPRNAFEYVIMHEFMHFLHPNHSNKFYEMLSTLMPDWKTRKNLLEATAFHISV